MLFLLLTNLDTFMQEHKISASYQENIKNENMKDHSEPATSSNLHLLYFKPYRHFRRLFRL